MIPFEYSFLRCGKWIFRKVDQQCLESFKCGAGERAEDRLD